MGTGNHAWAELKRVYLGKPKGRSRLPGVALVLGAGVSAGIAPDWQELLERMAKLLPGCKDLVKDLVDKQFTLPAIAAILEARYRDLSLPARKKLCPPESTRSKGVVPSEPMFADLVRLALYERLYDEVGKWPKVADLDRTDRFRKFVRETNATLDAVASLCALETREKRKKKIIRNPRIHAIATFNLDHLLQVYTRSRFEVHITRTVERPSKALREGTINIYHLHGCIRFDSKARNPRKSAPDSTVLTEHDYYDVFNQPTSFSNYTFLNILREHPCLFIGLSMTDENLRRLLHYSRQEREQAYRAEGRAEPEVEAVRHFAIQERWDPDIDSLREESLRRLGVKALWIPAGRFDKIPERLAKIYEADAGAGSWGELPR